MKPPTLIAHAGFGWDNMAEAVALVGKAHAAKFDIVVFPYYGTKEITGDGPVREELHKHKLVGGQIAALARQAKAVGIILGVECWTAKGIETLLALGIRHLMVNRDHQANISLWAEINRQEFPGTVYFGTDNPNAKTSINRVAIYHPQDAAEPLPERMVENRMGVRVPIGDNDAIARATDIGLATVVVPVTLAAMDEIGFYLAELRRRAKDADAGLGGQLHHEPGVPQPIPGGEPDGPEKETRRRWRPFGKGRCGRDRSRPEPGR